MKDIRERMKQVEKLALAPTDASGQKQDVAVLQSIVQHSVSLDSLKGELEKARLDLADLKVKLVELESLKGKVAMLEECLVGLDKELQGVVGEKLASLEARLDRHDDSLKDHDASLKEQAESLKSELGKVAVVARQLSGLSGLSGLFSS